VNATTRLLLALPLSAFLTIAPACETVDSTLGGSSMRADAPPLFEGMGPHKRKVTTSSAEAQKYFDQGLTWAYAFNHDEAIRSFEHVTRLDPSCAMAYWGIALCNGPHINNPLMDEARSKAAWEALSKAKELSATCTPVEKALIDALANRYADPAAAKLPLTFEERVNLDKGYADAMEKVYAQYGKDDSDVGTLYAESLMDTRPWDLWDKEYKPRPETPIIVSTIEHVLSIAPSHPGANHLYIHACEASKEPHKANTAADRLRTLVPASGHLVHMPAHIDVRTGRWGTAAEQNRQASKIDNRYREISPRQNFYRLYMAHNDHFLAWSCMMLGRKAEALSAARDMLRKVPEDWLKANAPIADAVAAIEIEVLLRFGEWDEVLKLSKPPEILPITIALWHFGRASSLNAKGELSKAREEQEAFRKAVAAVPQEAMMAQNKGHEVLAIAELILEGEILYREHETDSAIESLRKAAALEDQLRYMEPPDWLQPARHALGAVLMAEKKFSDAEQVYRRDLEVWPENAWSLFGLAESLKAQSKPEEGEVRARFQKAWKDADTKIAATCLCVEKK
jgi:tetratricopeptide (TPR) repeat protein